MAKYIIQDSTMSAIADAIREQTGKSDPLTPAQMVDEIELNLGDFSGLVDRTLTDIKHNDVNTVAAYAFYKYGSLKTVEFLNCLTVGASAFVGCTGLTSISLPNCTTAPISAFSGCTKIQNVTLGFTSLVGSTSTRSTNFPFVVAQSNITDVSLPRCSNIGTFTFQSYSSLQNISAPVCTSVAGKAFSSCTNLTSVYLPECTYVSDTAFTGCTKIFDVTLGLSSLTSTNFPFTAAKGTLTGIHFPNCTTIGSSTCVKYSSLKFIDFPVCTSIANAAFVSCSNLIAASFPRCTSFTGNEILNSPSLNNLTLGFQSISSANISFISHYGLLRTLHFPKCSLIWGGGFENVPYITYIDAPICETVGQSAFRSCPTLTAVDLSACQELNAYAFTGCSKLNNISIPVCTTIFNGVFFGCTSLSSISLPACMTIGSFGFKACSNLTSITLGGSSVVSLGPSAFVNTPMTDSSYTGSFGSIYVPASLVSAYRVAPNWLDIADRITAIVE